MECDSSVTKGSASFLKKRSKKLLFLPSFPTAGQFPYPAAGTGSKSFLLFFKQDVLAFLLCDRSRE